MKVVLGVLGGGISKLYKVQPKMVFHDNEMAAAGQILDEFELHGKRYVMLCAQMQSGKTAPQCWTALELLKLGKVDKIQIICGSNDKDLKEQWENDMSPEKGSHLRIYLKENFLDKSDDLDRFKDNIFINFRQDLEEKKSSEIEERIKSGNCIIVWDESHFAVGCEQMLSKFFERCGIIKGIQGDHARLVEKNLYILTTTATRCAELSKFSDDEDGVNKKNLQYGKVVAIPGEGYRGILHYDDKKAIKQSYPIEMVNFNEIKQIISEHKEKNKYFIIRARDSVQHTPFEILKDICSELNCDIIFIDQDNKMGEKVTKKIPFDVEPEKFTLVVIRGKFRMGKRLCKEHICAVYESSKDPNHNTMAQALLGRMCGYHTNDDITIYLPPTYIEKGLEEYKNLIKINFAGNISNTTYVSLRKSMKVKKNGNPTIPWVISSSNEKGDPTWGIHDAEFEEEESKFFKSLLLERLKNGAHLWSNDQETEIKKLLNNPGSKIAFRMSHKTKGENKGELNNGYEWGKLNNSITNNTPFGNWTGRGKCRSPFKPIIICKILKEVKECPSLKKGDLVVIFRIETRTMAPPYIPSNGKDLWHNCSNVIPVPEDIQMNGAQLVLMPKESYDHPKIFKKALKEMIKNSINKEKICQHTRCIYSNQHLVNGKSGIILSNDAFPNGIDEIIKKIEKKYNVKIVIKMKRGRKPNNCNDLRLDTISW